MPTDYGTNPNLDHWVKDDSVTQRDVLARRAEQLKFPEDVTSEIGEVAMNLTFSDQEHGGISERERLGVITNEAGEIQDWPSFMGKKEGRKYSRLKNPKYWRSMGPKGHTSATAVINEYEKLNSRIQRIGAEYDQATDETERDETAKRIKAWQQVKKDIESDDHLRSIINRE